ncbi:hypothetical protein KIN20_033523 [Parelaphostrongylus tenuis]|uniref:Uncharacterized protein n=1 Tax=Parelaphostrongylus tenuis TaxID=148309 RepID=A0AAD5WIB7_PARTN|nr:hypothetical protein KIN20_033523 [Parelaphostrongylus tenuis]
MVRNLYYLIVDIILVLLQVTVIVCNGIIIFVFASLLFGLLLGVVDLVLEFSLTSFHDAPNCAFAGCFFSDTYRYYWGISNMVMGIVLIISTIPFLIKLRALHQQPHRSGAAQLRENRFKQIQKSMRPPKWFAASLWLGSARVSDCKAQRAI